MEFYEDVCPGACVRVSVAVLGMLSNNVYLVENPADPDQCFLVDPSCQPEFILKALQGRRPQAIVLTHYHFDHVGAAAALREATGAPVYASRVDAPFIEGLRETADFHRKVEHCPVDVRLDGGEELCLAGAAWKVMLTPGHSAGSLCLFAAGSSEMSEKTCPVLISGDTLFAGSVGRTDFDSGSMIDMIQSLRELRLLPFDTRVLPGHGSLTTIEDSASTFEHYLGPEE